LYLTERKNNELCLIHSAPNLFFTKLNLSFSHKNGNSHSLLYQKTLHNSQKENHDWNSRQIYTNNFN